MRFRILKFAPVPKAAARPQRPRPSITHDNAFWFEGAKNGQLLIQRCASCGTLRHPPGPMCPTCHSLEWDTIEASGRGTVYSYVVNHYPQVPAFDYPLIVAVIELEEGTRLVSNLIDVEPADVAIGMAVEAEMVAFDDDLTLPQFRPARGRALMDFTFTDEQLAVRDSGGADLRRHGQRRTHQGRRGHRHAHRRRAVGRVGQGEPARSLPCPKRTAAAASAWSSCACCSQEQGRRLAPVPLLATMRLGALPLAEFGSADAAAPSGCRRS